MEEEEEPDGLAERAGAFAELPEVQLLLCVAILADVAGAAVGGARRRRSSVFGQGGGGLPGLREFSLRLRAAGAGDGLQAAHADAHPGCCSTWASFLARPLFCFFGSSMAL